MRGSSLETWGLSLAFRWSRIEDPRSYVFWKNDVVQSGSRSDIHTVNQCLQCSVTVWIVGVWQAFNKCKSIFSFSKISPSCTVYVPFAPHVPRFSQMNGAAQQFILWIKLVAHLAYVNNVDKVMRNYVCSRKQNFHVRVSVDTVAYHAVTVCKYANLHIVTQWFHGKLFLSQKATFSRAFELLNFPLANFT